MLFITSSILSAQSIKNLSTDILTNAILPNLPSQDLLYLGQTCKTIHTVLINETNKRIEKFGMYNN